MRTFVGDVPARVKALPVDRRGFPVPFFVAWVDGVPRFPVMDPAKMAQAIRNSKCWICGQSLGAYKAFVIGPMCCVNRISAEPPNHLDCARFAVLNCPFMAQPLAKRTVGEADVVGGAVVELPGGIMIERNPGVSAIWTTKSFKIERDGGHPLWRIGPAEKVSFWAKGRRATFDELSDSVAGGLPLLREMAEREGLPAMHRLQRQLDAFIEIVRGAEFEESREPIALPDISLRELGFGVGP